MQCRPNFRSCVYTCAIAYMTALLVSCAPTPISMTNDSVSIKYDVAINSPEDVRTQAENYCETMKKKASFKATTVEGLGLGVRYDHFDCVKP